MCFPLFGNLFFCALKSDLLILISRFASNKLVFFSLYIWWSSPTFLPTQKNLCNNFHSLCFPLSSTTMMMEVVKLHEILWFSFMCVYYSFNSFINYKKRARMKSVNLRVMLLNSKLMHYVMLHRHVYIYFILLKKKKVLKSINFPSITMKFHFSHPLIFQ